MKLSQLSLADYNQLDSIPVINQDLTASGFTPTANTYYRHTGATTDTFTQGVIYLYDTAYHKLGESGGTTLNRYEVTLDELVGNAQGAALLHKIITTAKGNYTVYNYNDIIIYDVLDRNSVIELRYYNQTADTVQFAISTWFVNDGHIVNNFTVTVSANGVTHGKINSWPTTRVVYFNDTEIT